MTVFFALIAVGLAVAYLAAGRLRRRQARRRHPSTATPDGPLREVTERPACPTVTVGPRTAEAVRQGHITVPDVHGLNRAQRRHLERSLKLKGHR